MSEGALFSLSVRCDEREAVIAVDDDGARLPTEVLARAMELVLARRSVERRYSLRIPLDNGGLDRSMPPPTFGAKARRRILVVDDNIDAADSLALLLRELGHDVQVAYDGHAALEAARINRPHIVLLDISMPGIDGYRVVERLRREPHFAAVAMVAVTGSAELADRKRSTEAGFADHLIKPVSLDTLRRLLAGL